MKGISDWIREAQEDYWKYQKDLTEKYDYLTQTFALNAWTVQRDKFMLKHQILTTMLKETSQTEGKLYSENPEHEWIVEFRLAWDRSGGAELDKQLSFEYALQAERSQKALESDAMWEVAKVQEVAQEVATEVHHDPWSVVQQEQVQQVPSGQPAEIMPLSTPPPNGPPKM